MRKKKNESDRTEYNQVTLLKSSESIYYTLTSVISSAILGIFLSQISELSLTEFKLWTWAENVFYIAMILITFTIIIITWHVYVMGLYLFKWYFKWSDSIIPFLFGISQYLIVKSLDLKGGTNALSESKEIFQIFEIGFYSSFQETHLLWQLSLCFYALLAIAGYKNQNKNINAAENINRAFLNEGNEIKDYQNFVTRNSMYALLIFFLLLILNLSLEYSWITGLLSITVTGLIFVYHIRKINIFHIEIKNIFIKEN